VGAKEVDPAVQDLGRERTALTTVASAPRAKDRRRPKGAENASEAETVDVDPVGRRDDDIVLVHSGFDASAQTRLAAAFTELARAI
jgi:hypothetical protein